MKWSFRQYFIIFLFIFCSSFISIVQSNKLSPSFLEECDVTDENCRKDLREEVKEMFFHAYNGYLNYAFPQDELKPLSCDGRSRSMQNSRGHMDYVLGNYSLTLIDSLDTLFIMNEIQKFEEGVEFIIENVNFDKDVTISLFESTIRVLGGLLSIHSISEHFQEKFSPNFVLKTQNQILNLAKTLGTKFLPAFETQTSIPFSHVNLKNGIETQNLNTQTSVAEAGSLILEFGMLSHYTNDSIFYEKANDALQSLYSKKSSLNLFGEIIDVNSGNWKVITSGIGSNCDSFFEYLLKSYFLFGDETFLEMFETSYRAIEIYLKNNGIYYQSDMNTGNIIRDHSSSLQAFWPGLQIMYGDIQSAIFNHNHFYKVTKQMKFLPELWSVNSGTIFTATYPLRPEFVESTWLLYRATKHPFYLNIGKEMIKNLQNLTRTSCGFASYDIQTKNLEDRMDSFFLSETLKYLYLLFDSENPFNFLHNDWIFTTEAHMFPKISKNNLFNNNIQNNNQNNNFKEEICDSHFHPLYEEELKSLDFVKNHHLKMEDFLKKIDKQKVEKFLEKKPISKKIMTEELILKLIPETSVLGRLRVEGISLLNFDYTVVPAHFGTPLNISGITSKLSFGDPSNGCSSQKVNLQDKFAVFDRGECTFEQKYQTALQSNAKGLIVINTDNYLIYMTSSSSLSKNKNFKKEFEEEFEDEYFEDETEKKEIRALEQNLKEKKENEIPAVLISFKDGNFLRDNYLNEDVTLFAIQEYHFDKNSGKIGEEIHTLEILENTLHLTFPNLPLNDLNTWILQKLDIVEKELNENRNDKKN